MELGRALISHKAKTSHLLNGRIASTVHMTEEDALTCAKDNGWTVHKVVIE